jgi:hypothetical protein
LLVWTPAVARRCWELALVLPYMKGECFTYQQLE